MTKAYSFDKLLLLQKELDEEIMKLHGGSYPDTYSRRLLALFVELGEFANETRAFKYWSLKEPSPKERILDEFSDALHFFLSLALASNITHLEVPFPSAEKEDRIALSDSILEVYEEALRFGERKDEESYLLAFNSFLSLLPKMGYTLKDMEEAYLKKMAVNHKRQEERY